MPGHSSDLTGIPGDHTGYEGGYCVQCRPGGDHAGFGLLTTGVLPFATCVDEGMRVLKVCMSRTGFRNSNLCNSVFEAF